MLSCEMDSEESGELPEEPRARPTDLQQSNEGTPFRAAAARDENEEGQPARKSTTHMLSTNFCCCTGSQERLAPCKRHTITYMSHRRYAECVLQSLLPVDGTLPVAGTLPVDGTQRMMKKQRKNQSSRDGAMMTREMVPH